MNKEEAYYIDSKSKAALDNFVNSIVKDAIDKFRNAVITEIIDTYEYNYPTASGDFDEFYKMVINIVRNTEI